MREPRVFTIPSGRPFLPTLADAILSGMLTDGWPAGTGLADATVYLPTRRAGRALVAVLAERNGGRATLMPRIVPLGDADEAGGPEPDRLSGVEAALPPIAPLERRLILTHLVQAWAAKLDGPADLALAPGTPILVPGSPADAVALAGDLEALMDGLTTEGVNWDALADAVEIDFSRYFALTLRFVRIAHEHWPRILADRGASDPTQRRHEALEAEAGQLLARPSRGPVIAAGSTGSVPATARLLAAIAHAPHGAVVLPGLDTDLDQAAWDLIGGDGEAGDAGEGDPKEGGAESEPLFGHPQYMLRRLLTRFIGIDRETVRILRSTTRSDRGGDEDGGEDGGEDADADARQRFLSEALRPAATTDVWALMPTPEREALARAGSAGMALIEAVDEREEALAVALALRETLAEPGRTAALVTPDRALARRVSVELGRWGILVEDSAGTTLADAPFGQLARLAAEAAALDFHPVQVLALLAHPAVTLGLSRSEGARARAALEIGAFRGPAPAPGLDGLAAALAHRRAARGRRDPLPRQNLADADWDLAATLLQRLTRAFSGFADAGDDDPIDMIALAARHAEAVEALAIRAPGDEVEPDGSADTLFALFDELALAAATAASGVSVQGAFRDYPAFFAALARERTLAPEPATPHPRVRILGLLEARLLGADRVVLGGLDEGVWPPAAQGDAFLNRPMRLGLGLSPPERRIGQTAHDLAQALGARDAILTRAAKRDGKPTVPSRFLQRMRAFAGKDAWTAVTDRGRRYLQLAAAIDAPGRVEPIRRPAPQPGPERFPAQLGVTEIETLVRDPYAIHARHILRLTALDRIAVAPSAAERGSLLHDVLADFTKLNVEGAAKREHALFQIGLDAFRERDIEATYPELYALWWPAFERLVPKYLAWEAGRLEGLASLHVELRGKLLIPVDGREPFRVVARADRIEIGESGGADIIDFKTGTVPSSKQVAVGFSPQLTLEAAMLMAGGFEGLPAVPDLPALHYVKLGGRAILKGEEVAPPLDDGRSLREIVDAHRAGLAGLVHRYSVEGAGYLSRPYAQYAQRFSDYDHLARVKEWSATGGADDDGAAGASEPA